MTRGVYVWWLGVATDDVGVAHGNMWDVQLVERLEKRLRELTERYGRVMTVWPSGMNCRIPAAGSIESGRVTGGMSVGVAGA